ncbi:hypothetical protein ACERII_13955 [Evansella sp. AB-rgal1]|uniref:hypothetical protein n=1 Tax=Evansella sp. AB-rgal1 TaxID=3242696 RepID=UPI00359D823C
MFERLFGDILDAAINLVKPILDYEITLFFSFSVRVVLFVLVSIFLAAGFFTWFKKNFIHIRSFMDRISREYDILSLYLYKYKKDFISRKILIRQEEVGINRYEDTDGGVEGRSLKVNITENFNSFEEALEDFKRNQSFWKKVSGVNTFETHALERFVEDNIDYLNQIPEGSITAEDILLFTMVTVAVNHINFARVHNSNLRPLDFFFRRYKPSQVESAPRYTFHHIINDLGFIWCFHFKQIFTYCSWHEHTRE